MSANCKYQSVQHMAIMNECTKKKLTHSKWLKKFQSAPLVLQLGVLAAQGVTKHNFESGVCEIKVPSVEFAIFLRTPSAPPVFNVDKIRQASQAKRDFFFADRRTHGGGFASNIEAMGPGGNQRHIIYKGLLFRRHQTRSYVLSHPHTP